ncbi:MAG: YcaO-like family protein [Alphaproteobacteria bacterium]|nr:YcaO-like family protein [Alphaproteobacteria bacterium]MCB9931729.1 YcaO-like family protein [Alphaproteobacteria bacterium]
MFKFILEADEIRQQLKTVLEDCAKDEHHTDMVSSTVDALVRHSARLDLLIAIVPPEAPGLHFIGGVATVDGRKISLTGTGETFSGALTRLNGELAEAIARALASRHSRPPLVLGGCAVAADTDGRTVDFGDSNGCAAHIDLEDASFSALLELIERDAAMLWWRGGRPADVLQLQGPSRARFRDFRNRLRADGEAREDLLLLLSEDFGVATVAAVSFAPNGLRFASGIAARPDAFSAACAAFREMCQMEVGLRLAALKREHSGEQGLSDGDRRQLRRARLITRAMLPISDAAARRGDGEPASTRAAGDQVRALASRLAQDGLEPALFDLSVADSPFVVAKAICPKLQSPSYQHVSARLRNVQQSAHFDAIVGHNVPLY